MPTFPGLDSARACGDQVCVSPADGAALWKWVRDAQRWADEAQLCEDIRQ
jgi:hypothetical protein